MVFETRLGYLIRQMIDRKIPIEGIAAADASHVIAEHHFTPDQPRNIYSHTKSYTSAAAGIAIDDGVLSLDTTLAEIFPEYVPEDASPALFTITLRHLLTMSSGFGGAYLMNENRRAGTGFPDYVGYMMRQEIRVTPGEKFCYSTADSILAGRMIERVTGKNLAAFLYERLLKPLDIPFPVWECCPEGHPIGGGGMFLSLTDMMKIGQLWLNDGICPFGKHKGERLISSEWVKESSKQQIKTGGGDECGWNCGYGYQFWMSPYAGAYRADGAYGQITTVFPYSRLVIAVQCPESGDFGKVKQLLHTDLFSGM